MLAKPASQLRSQQKRDRILAAMDVLLRTRPFAGISVGDLAAQARVPVATVYQRFSNDDVMGAVLLALYFAKVQEWAQRPRLKASSPSISLHAQLLEIATDAMGQIQALGHVMRPAYLYSRQHPHRAEAEWSRLEQLAREGFGAFIRTRAADLSLPDTNHAADVLCDLFNFMLIGPLLHDDSPRWRMPGAQAQFAETLATLAHRYLTGKD